MGAGNQFVNDPKIPEGNAADVLQDPILEAALRGYRDSVRAWSEAAYQRPRSIVSPVSGRSMSRLAITGALGCAIVVGGIGTGIHQQHRRQEMARISAQRLAEHQRELAMQKARETEDLLAQVDKDVSREVPSAMDPLAQLMTAGDGQ